MAGTPIGPNNSQGNIDQLKKKGIGMGGRLMNHGFIGLDTFMRVKDGEKLPVALGKAVLTNAAFSLIPGGIVGGMAAMAVMSAPDMMNQLDQATSALGAKKQQFGGNFQESETQMYMMQQGLGRMQDARMQATRRMANHARGAQKVY
ncbi:hypothetical protein LAV82_23180 [Bacillus sp. ILBB4]|nr:hypothetical protein [Bacillus sp. ILBB4]